MMLSTEIQIDLEKLATCPGLHVAIGWIMAAHDYEAILHLEALLMEQDEHQTEVSRFSAEHRNYLTRLRVAQTREAIGLCNKTEKFPNLLELIKRDPHGAAESFDHLLKLNVEGPKNNSDMELVWNIRNNTFHYCLDDSSDSYSKTIVKMLERGERFIKIGKQRTFPDRFEPVDQLFQRTFLTQILGIEIENPVEAGKRFNVVAQTLVQIGDDVSVIARAMSQGITELYLVVDTDERH